MLSTAPCSIRDLTLNWNWGKLFLCLMLTSYQSMATSSSILKLSMMTMSRSCTDIFFQGYWNALFGDGKCSWIERDIVQMSKQWEHRGNSKSVSRPSTSSFLSNPYSEKVLSWFPEFLFYWRALPAALWSRTTGSKVFSLSIIPSGRTWETIGWDRGV